MARRFLILAFVLLLAAPSIWAGDLLDRIVATVNGHIILQSDWEDTLRYQALVSGGQVAQISSAERKAALDRLIDQELLQEQMHASDFKHASQSEVEQRVLEIRKQYPNATNAAAWQGVLNRYGFDANTLRQRVTLDLDLLSLVDARLRPRVSIDFRSIESYYNQELLPQLRQSGAKAVPLADATSKIKEVLIQQKVNELLEAWLMNLRSGSRIQTASTPNGSQGEMR
jgi:peptidyl-prolyl cis-trans isomerase SurA